MNNEKPPQSDNEPEELDLEEDSSESSTETSSEADELDFEEEEAPVVENEDKDEEGASEEVEVKASRSPNALVIHPPNESLEDNGYKEARLIFLPPDLRERVNSNIDEVDQYFSQFDDDAEELQEIKTDEAQRWYQSLRDSMSVMLHPAVYKDIFTDPKKEFKQGFSSSDGEDKDLLTIAPFNLKERTGNVKGPAALAIVAKKLNLGNYVKVPLYHSGFWVFIKPPAERDLIRFWHSIMRSKVALGRESAGFIFSHFSVYLANDLFDFIADHIHETSVEGLSKEDFKKKIRVQDLPLLAWGFAEAIYPDGFEYTRNCVNVKKQDNEFVCKKQVTGKINVSKLVWFDNKVLTQEQRRHMSNAKIRSVSLKEVENYQSSFKAAKTKDMTFDIADQRVKFILKNPTLDRYFEAGSAWVDFIINQVEDIMLKEVSGTEEEIEEQKEILINDFVKTSLLRRYEHFIDGIVIDDLEITDRATIPGTLDLLTAEKEVLTRYEETINAFLTENTHALIGIPTYECPCGFEQKDTNPYPRFKDVIALDPIDLFFVLATLRTQRIMARVL